MTGSMRAIDWLFTHGLDIVSSHLKTELILVSPWAAFSLSGQ